VGIAVAILTIAVLVIAGLVAALSPASSGSDQDQCAKPISERVGGWTCPAP
jgi:hypothetical protein